MISPRAFHFEAEAGTNSTERRGIFHLKDEPFASKYHRLHILCGESLCSETAMWLKLATTALVVTLIEADALPDISFRTPVSQMKLLAKLRPQNVELALTIQYRLLSAVEKNLRIMPEWAEDACQEWRRILDLIRTKDSRIYRTLDWAIKQMLYSQYVNDKCGGWTNVTPQIARELQEIDKKFSQLGTGIFAELDKTGALTHHMYGVSNIDDAIVNPPVGTRAYRRGIELATANRQDDLLVDWDFIINKTEGQLLLLDNPFEQGTQWLDISTQQKYRLIRDEYNLSFNLTHQIRNYFRYAPD